MLELLCSDAVPSLYY